MGFSFLTLMVVFILVKIYTSNNLALILAIESFIMLILSMFISELVLQIIIFLITVVITIVIYLIYNKYIKKSS